MSGDLFTRVLLEALITEREAMLAANRERERRGEAQAYDEKSFMVLAGAINQLRERF
jgi:hypothetical protein